MKKFILGALTLIPVLAISQVRTSVNQTRQRPANSFAGLNSGAFDLKKQAATNSNIRPIPADFKKTTNVNQFDGDGKKDIRANPVSNSAKTIANVNQFDGDGKTDRWVVTDALGCQMTNVNKFDGDGKTDLSLKQNSTRQTYSKKTPGNL